MRSFLMLAALSLQAATAAASGAKTCRVYLAHYIPALLSQDSRICFLLPTWVLCDPCRKSFVETRSVGAVAVAFSRVYVLHALLLCWMSLLVSTTPN